MGKLIEDIIAVCVEYGWEKLAVLSMIGADPFYRVAISVAGWVNVTPFDITDPLMNGDYDSIDALPPWVHESVCILRTLDYSREGHTIAPVKIEGIGCRMGENVFWLLRRES